MKPKMMKANCSFCGREIECPENMMDIEKHACVECFQNLEKNPGGEDISKVHVDIPMDKLDIMMPQILTDRMMEEVFPLLWKDKKSELKKMSRRELAEEMFGAGAYVMAETMIKMSKEVRENSEG